VLDCGNSGTTMRLFAGILAGQPFESTLDGDASLRGRPMARIIEPLRAMGADITGSGPDGTRPPLRIGGRPPLGAIDWTTPVPSAQVKSAILLAGLRAGGTTRVHEAVGTRDHTEHMLRARGVDVRTAAEGPGWAIEVDGGQHVAARDEFVWADPSAAAFWLVAGAIHPAAELRLSHVDLNPRRRAAIDLLRQMGASIEVIDVAESELAGGDDSVGDLVVRSSALRGIEVGPAETAAAIDEIPVLCLAATQARGRTVVRGAGELRHKESDRIAGIVGGLTALGARIESVADDIVIEGPTALRGTVVDSHGDHRLALSFAIAGLVAEGATTIRAAESVGISYPTFFADLERIRS
jgi:3-phosphoshikimate 1-carboxyvinyltransferase